ncbi:kinase-like protein [Ganoderma leucocontextum]|nr:kinase-like protein [Ganoderma leucocontextum]
MQYTFLEGANAIWHRVRAWPIAVNSPIPPVNSPLYPKGPTAWASVAYYNAPNMDFSPSPRLLAFQPGHVLTLGGDQYRIHRKLRGQAVSTVWLAEHTVRGASRRRFVALETFDRIFSTSTALQVRAEPRSPTTDLNYIRNIIASQDRGLPGAEHCDRLRAVFLPDRHLYAVKDPTGPTVWDLQLTQPNLSFSLAVTKRIIGDTLRALQYVHSFGRAAVGVASHNLLVTQQCSQDSMSANIVQFLQSHPPEMVDPSANRKKSSSTSGTSDTSTQISPSPKTKSSTPSKGKANSPAPPLATKASATPKPKSLATVLKAQPLPAFGLSPSLDNIQVRLTRCEHATLDKQLLQTHAKEGNKPARLIDYYHSELKLCSPEALRGAPERWSPPVNIWAIGHLAFQFLTGHYIYGLRANPEVEGPALPSWLELVLISHPRTRMLEERLRAFPHATAGMSADDVRATCAFIGRCLEMDPAKRATAAELLQDEWFR